MRESHLERKFVLDCKKRGWACIKLKGGHSATGWPDRLVTLNNGRVIFVELKTNSGSLTKAQELVCDELRRCRCIVEVLRPSNYEQTMRWLKGMSMPSYDRIQWLSPCVLERGTQKLRTGGVIVVEGAIGVGKSTICRELAMRHPDVIVHDELDEHMKVLVDQYYEGKLSPLDAQLSILKYRHRRYVDVIRNSPDKWHVFDRSMWGDYVFAEANLSDDPQAHKAYNQEYNALMRSVGTPALQVYIRSDLATCITRIQTRGREKEVGLAATDKGKKYLEQIIRSGWNWHIDTLSAYIPTYTLNAVNADLAEIKWIIHDIMYLARRVPSVERTLLMGDEWAKGEGA